MIHLKKSELLEAIREARLTGKLQELFGSDDNQAIKAARKKAMQASIDAKQLELNNEKKNLSAVR